MSRLPALAAAVAALALFAASPAQAHPHVTVEHETVLLHDAEGQVTGFRHAWTFDEFYSTYATQGLDANRDGVFSREELAEITRVNLEHLGERGFFTVMRHERRFVSFGQAADAWSEMKNGKLVMHFTVPLRTPFRAAGRPLTFEVYDPEFFVAFLPAEGEAMRLEAPPAGCGLDYTPPRRGDARGLNLGEAFFQALSPNSNFGAQFAGRYTVNCR